MFKYTQYIHTCLKMLQPSALVYIFFLLKIVLISYKAELNMHGYYHMVITVCTVKFQKRIPELALKKTPKDCLICFHVDFLPLRTG